MLVVFIIVLMQLHFYIYTTYACSIYYSTNAAAYVVFLVLYKY